MQFIAATGDALPADLLRKLGRYRHHVFVERLGWNLATNDGMEFDQFDRPDTLHILALQSGRRLIGTARLLSTERPYLLSEVFPQLLNGAPPPRSAEVWELSRFAALDPQAAGTGGMRQIASPVASALLRQAMLLASKGGAKSLISVSPLGIERMLARLGVHARRAGRPMDVEGRTLFACWIDVAQNRATDVVSATGQVPPPARRQQSAPLHPACEWHS